VSKTLRWSLYSFKMHVFPSLDASPHEITCTFLLIHLDAFELILHDNLNLLAPNRRRPALQTLQTQVVPKPPATGYQNYNHVMLSWQKLTSTPLSGTPSQTPLPHRSTTGKQSTNLLPSPGLVYSSSRSFDSIADTPLSNRYRASGEVRCVSVSVRRETRCG